MGQTLKSFARNESGTSVVELGFAAPLVAFLFMGMVDTASGIAMKHRLEQAAQRSIEMATAYGTAGSDFSDIDDDAAEAADVPTSQVRFDRWLECDGVRQDSFYEACESDEQFARYVKVEIDGFYQPTFTYGPLGRAVGVNREGVIPMTVDASVRIQ